MSKDSKTKKSLKIPKTVIKIAVAVIAAVIAVVVAADLIVILSVSGRIHSIESYEPERKYDCIIVLGCAVHKDKSPSSFLKDRLATAVCLYNEGVADKILLSGDKNDAEEYDEVEAMYEYCIGAGVDPEDIFLDVYGYSTYETMYRAYYYYGVRSAVVVTQGYHIYRSTYIACGLGIDAVGVKAVNSGYVIAPHNYLRESVAMVKDLVQTLCRTATVPCGNVYEITGDGSITRADYY
ncbi:MAG: YdcF family protein [Clostridiales bacterium]|nr:YdcF family protein [Clostridiales bacterium]